jgi:hypothetical protein
MEATLSGVCIGPETPISNHACDCRHDRDQFDPLTFAINERHSLRTRTVALSLVLVSWVKAGLIVSFRYHFAARTFAP